MLCAPTFTIFRCSLEECYNVENEINICFDGHCSSKEPHTMFVLKCVSKLFYKDGTGDPNFYHVFFKSKVFDSVPIMNFRGSRFNVCFYRAAGTFFLFINFYYNIFYL